MRTEEMVRDHKKYIEDIIKSLEKRIDKDNILVKQTISTLQDEAEVLKWVIKEPSDHVGA